MVCIYCGSFTRVINSRLQHRINNVWRRRRCTKCSAIFSSQEAVVLEGSFAVVYDMSHITPFQRDILFLSIYEACRHRSKATLDATALTNTVISKVITCNIGSQGAIQRNELQRIVRETLEAFDHVAQVHYTAFHPTNLI
jgi:transcriptional regulator NrdR family protein